MGYRILDHTADTGIEAEAATPGELFAEAARGFADSITDLDAVEERCERELRVGGSGLENLLVDWLDELLYAFDVHGEIYSRVEVDLRCGGREYRLTARAFGEPFDPARHPLKVPIKAVTYHGLEVRRDEKEERWRARVIFDI